MFFLIILEIMCILRGKDRYGCEEMCEGHFKCKNQAKYFMYMV